MSVTNVFPSHDQMDRIIGHLGQLCVNTGGYGKVRNWRDLRAAVRDGRAREVLEVGDTFLLDRATGAAAEVSGLTSASVSLPEFISAVGSAAAGTYEFTYDGAVWRCDGKVVTPGNYGISFVGTPSADAKITVTVTSKAWECDVLGFDYDTPADTALHHSVSMALRDLSLYGVSYCPRQAVYAAEDAALPAGDYHFRVTNNPFVSVDVGKYLTFHLDQALPVGGQLVLGGSYDATMIGTTVKAYASPSDVTELTSAILSEGEDGEYLGALKNAGDPQNHMNSVAASLMGCNEYRISVMRQYLNSAAPGAAEGAAASWYAPQTAFDRPVITTEPGFLYGADPAFAAVIGTVKKRTAKNTVAAGGGYADTEERIFALSRTEVLGTANGDVYETSFGTAGTGVLTVPYEFYAGASAADYIKRENRTARRWCLRSPGVGQGHVVLRIADTGALSSTLGASGTNSGFVPAWAIV